MTRILLTVLTALACSSAAYAQVDNRVIYAGVVNDRGEPVAGLSVKDFIVREDGVAREVLAVAKDQDPLQIALLVDNSVEMQNKVVDLRRGLTAFVKAIRPGIQVSLITLAERPTIVVPYTADRAVLQKAIDGLVTWEAGNYVLDAIAEVSQGLSQRPQARSVIAIVTARGPEMSYRQHEDVLRIVRESGTPALHVTMIGGTSVDARMADVQRDPRDSGDQLGGTGRDFILGRLTRETGGRYEEIQATSALDLKLQQMASELSNQYRVTFASPQRLVPATKTEISARDPKLTARGMLMSVK
jgi:VWFA-related protein